jgi:hypothetical protein
MTGRGMLGTAKRCGRMLGRIGRPIQKNQKLVAGCGMRPTEKSKKHIVRLIVEKKGRPGLNVNMD